MLPKRSGRNRKMLEGENVITKAKKSKLKAQGWKFLFWLFAGVVLLISVANISLLVRNNFATWQRSPIETEIKQWEEIVAKTPTYRDGYLKLATLYWQLREDDKAKAALEKAYEIDPNYKETDKLKRELDL